MYEGPDQGWRRRPHFMSRATISRTFDRIAEQARDEGLQSVSVVLHGGEPLLAGLSRLAEYLTIGECRLARESVSIHWALQTNAILMSSELIDLLLAHNVAIGVSVDGTVKAHDSRRVDKAGRGTFARVVESIEAMQRRSNGAMPQSLIAVIDFEADPREVLNGLEKFGVRHLDLLLPDKNWDEVASIDMGRVTWWLETLLNEYMTNNWSFRIRMIQTLLKLFAGGVWGSDAWGAFSGGTLIVETDGTYEYHDVLKTAATGVGDSGESVFTASVGAVGQHEVMRMMTTKLPYVADACRRCEFQQVCGGGHIAHRFSTERKFDNPSVYCKAIAALCTQIENYSNAFVARA